MTRVLINSLIITGVLLSSAEMAFAKTDLSAQIGTLSLGIRGQQLLTDSIIIRTNITTLNYENNSLENVSKDLQQQLDNTGSTIADFHPWTGGFRLSAGFFYNTETTSTKSLSYSTVGNNEQNSHPINILPLSEKTEQQPLIPYVGLGWGLTPTGASNWVFSVDVGVMYQGVQETTLTAPYNRALPVNSTAEEDFQDILESFGWYPILSAGVTFKF